MTATALLPSEMPTSWASGIGQFRGWPTAHTFTYLRIAAAVTRVVARLATGLPGSALTGRDSHPQDDSSKFQAITTSFLLDQHGPGRTGKVPHLSVTVLDHARPTLS